MIGLSIAKHLWLNNWFFVKSLLTLANLFSSNFSALNARTTLIPLKFSSVTPLTLSINFCTISNLGNTIIKSIPIVINKINTHTPVKILHSRDLLTILVIAHTAIIGALINICNPIAINISNWVISFVVLVIKLLTLNFFISAVLKFNTFLNTFSLKL